MAGKFIVVSDTHIKHKNIVRGISAWDRGYRDFNTQDEHDFAVIDEINKKADENDVLLHGGDWVFGDKQANLEWFLSKLRVKKIISCVGNHDKEDVLFSAFGRDNVHQIYNFKYKGKSIVMSHYYIPHWKDRDHGTLHLFGHLHSNPRLMHGRSMDIGLDGNNMQVYDLDEVVDILMSQPIGEGRHE